ncbi:hypothetical protein [uncultured Cohaesibacter sp.]|uniref:hypothetical protein n=1 Tax=uncultured Cohaesibacter sp. TaxID=1002546 RepID=UPI0029C64282|nr:hypothetical protein [uncultured Cohaesibacter sp.]
MPKTHLLALALIAFSSPAFATSCFTDVPSSPEVAPAAFTSFQDQLEAMDNPGFVERFCSLLPVEKGFAIRIYQSAYEGLAADRQQHLLRASIMVPDIEKNLAWVAENGTIRQEDEGEWESIGIARFVKNLRLQFPDVSSVLDDAYFDTIRATYRKAHDLIVERENNAARKVVDAEDEIEAMQQRISELRSAISDYKEDLRGQRVIRHELELYKPDND